jgi:hypothetical protein
MTMSNAWPGQEDEEPAYNKLVSTLRLSGAHAKLLARRRREERGKEKTAVAHEVMCVWGIRLCTRRGAVDHWLCEVAMFDPYARLMQECVGSGFI